ncbi:MAG: SIR2 family protein [Chloroflexi bacterium]|nr:SIR2 family protein [Chloroflexota bacterium]
MAGGEAKGLLKILTIDALVRSVEVNTGSPYSILLGAGASVNSGIPSAIDCIWQWKRSIVVSQNPSLRDQLSNLALQAVRDQIQRWLNDQEEYPDLGANEEYGYYAEKCYPIPSDRAKFFQSLSRQAKPSVGYKVLCLLALSGVVDTVWTTNFDGLVPRVAGSMTNPQITIIEAGMDTRNRVERKPSANELLHVYLHGDYRYDALKNTAEEVRSMESEFVAHLVRHLRDTDLIVIGYSGRDLSVMSGLSQAYAAPGNGRLFWCGYDNEKPDDAVITLLETAAANNREAFYISTEGFDDVMLRLGTVCLQAELRDRADALRNQAIQRQSTSGAPFSVGTGTPTAVIRSNAVEIECPAELYQFEVSMSTTESPWKQIRAFIGDRRIAAGFLKGKVLALGTLDDIRQAFGSQITTEVSITHIDTKELQFEDSVVTGILLEAISKYLSAEINLGMGRFHRSWQLWNLRSSETVNLGGTVVDIHDAVVLNFRTFSNHVYLSFTPRMKGFLRNGDPASNDQDREINYQLTAKQYNGQYHAAISDWINKLFPAGSTTIEFPTQGARWKFRVHASSPSLATVSSFRAKNSISLPKSLESQIRHHGTEYRDPSLVFRNMQGDGFVKDVHPIRGLARNQPYDFRLNDGVLGREIQLAVICPKLDTPRVSTFLNSFQFSVKPRRQQDEYLLEYPGFSSAFGVPLRIPQPSDNLWLECPEIDEGLDVVSGASMLHQHILRLIDSIRAGSTAKAIIIYVPDRWEKWTRYDVDHEYFDLHDSIKAYCVQNGVATQFLRDKPINYPDQCRIKWWLSLAIYVKALRTPWALESIDADTAFMGVGYSIVRNAPKGRQIVVGCSHIFDSAGLGLGYRLSKVEDPFFDRQKNPHLSREDARRSAENTQQLLYHAGRGLPKRIVIHKNTRFTRDEVAGFTEGFAGIASVDMIEISSDHALRFTACTPSRNGNLQADNFPIRRGTAILLESKRALLWTHGVTEAVIPGRRYFLGGRHIPTPLQVTRHAGSSSLAVLAQEILGLTKMNWNNMDLYSKLPATIETAGMISRIGLLLERFGSPPYDYRLFI